MKMTSKGKLYIGTYANGLIISDPVSGRSEHLTMGPGLNDLNGNDIFCVRKIAGARFGQAPMARALMF